jgi:hypothetical protein
MARDYNEMVMARYAAFFVGASQAFTAIARARRSSGGSTSLSCVAQRSACPQPMSWNSRSLMPANAACARRSLQARPSQPANLPRDLAADASGSDIESSTMETSKNLGHIDR